MNSELRDSWSLRVQLLRASLPSLSAGYDVRIAATTGAGLDCHFLNRKFCPEFQCFRANSRHLFLHSCRMNPRAVCAKSHHPQCLDIGPLLPGIPRRTASPQVILERDLQSPAGTSLRHAAVRRDAALQNNPEGALRLRSSRCGAWVDIVAHRLTAVPHM